MSRYDRPGWRLMDDGSRESRHPVVSKIGMRFGTLCGDIASFIYHDVIVPCKYKWIFEKWFWKSIFEKTKS